METLADIVIVARQELAATFRGRRALALGGLFGFLVIVPALLRLLGQHGSHADALRLAHSAALVKVYDRDIARALLDCPPPLVVVAIATFFLQPLIVLLAGADRLAADIDSGSIRYLSVRAPRATIVVGKALGLWGVVSLLTAAVQGAVAAIAIIDAPRAWATTLGWASYIMLLGCAPAFVYVSLCTLVSVVVPRPRLVLIIGLGVVLAGRVARGALHEHQMDRLAALFPSSIDHLLLSAGPAAKAAGVGVVALWTALMLSGAALVFRRRAL